MDQDFTSRAQRRKFGHRCEADIAPSSCKPCSRELSPDFPQVLLICSAGIGAPRDGGQIAIKTATPTARFPRNEPSRPETPKTAQAICLLLVTRLVWNEYVLTISETWCVLHGFPKYQTVLPWCLGKLGFVARVIVQAQGKESMIHAVHGVFHGRMRGVPVCPMTGPTPALEMGGGHPDSPSPCPDTTNLSSAGFPVVPLGTILAPLLHTPSTPTDDRLSRSPKLDRVYHLWQLIGSLLHALGSG